MNAATLDTPDTTITASEIHGITGPGMTKLFNCLADGQKRTVQQLHERTGVKETTIPSFLRGLRQKGKIKGFDIHCTRIAGVTHYRLHLNGVTS